MRGDIGTFVIVELMIAQFTHAHRQIHSVLMMMRRKNGVLNSLF